MRDIIDKNSCPFIRSFVSPNFKNVSKFSFPMLRVIGKKTKSQISWVYWHLNSLIREWEVRNFICTSLSLILWLPLIQKTFLIRPRIKWKALKDEKNLKENLLTSNFNRFDTRMTKYFFLWRCWNTLTPKFKKSWLKRLLRFVQKDWK